MRIALPVSLPRRVLPHIALGAEGTRTNTLFGDSSGDDASNRKVSSLFLLRGERHQEVAIYNSNMNLQSPYVDAKYSYVDVARSFDKSTISASPSFNYLQEPMENNLRAATFYPSNL